MTTKLSLNATPLFLILSLVFCGSAFASSPVAPHPIPGSHSTTIAEMSPVAPHPIPGSHSANLPTLGMAA